MIALVNNGGDALGYFNPEAVAKLDDEQKNRLSAALIDLENTMVKLREAASKVIEIDRKSGNVVEWEMLVNEYELNEAMEDCWDNSRDLIFEDYEPSEQE